MALFSRIWIAVSAVNLVVLMLFVLLTTLQFDSINSGLVGERLAVLAARTSAPFAAAARIGLPLETVRNAEALLERARQTDDAILAVHVFDASGRVLHSTSEAPSDTIASAALAARAAARGERWHVEDASGFFSGIEIADPKERSVGGIVIVYPIRTSVTRTRAMLAELAIAAMAVVLLAAALGALLLRLGLVRQIAAFDQIDGQIAAFERGAWRSAAGAPAIDDSAGDLGELLDAAEARYRRAGRTLAAISCAPAPGDPG